MYVSFRIQYEWGKMQTRIIPNANTFYVVLIKRIFRNNWQFESKWLLES